METKEITIVERVDELANVSGKALEFEVQELTKLADQAKAITTADDKAFKEVKSEMVKKRNYIKQYCLDARRDIKKVAEGVSEVENMLYDIFVPEENRLIQIADEAKKAKEKEERKAVLPQRIERLKAIWGEDYFEEEAKLLEMDGATFEAYFNQNQAEKIEADRAEIARQQAEMDARAEEQRKEQERLDWEAKAAERAELARQEERKRIEQEQADKEAQEKAEAEREEREQREQRERAEKEEAERVEREKKEEADRKAKLEADQRYQAWLTEIGYNPEEFILDNSTEGSIVAYKIVSTFKK